MGTIRGLIEMQLFFKGFSYDLIALGRRRSSPIKFGAMVINIVFSQTYSVAHCRQLPKKVGEGIDKIYRKKVAAINVSLN